MSRALRAASFRHLLRHPAQLALALLGLTVGVATITAVDLATEGARRAFSLSIDAVNGTIDVKLTDEEFVARKKDWHPRENHATSGYLWKYAQQVGPAVDGAVTHPGGAAEKECYADS